MSESSYKYTTSGRRQPAKRRQRVRAVQKPGNSQNKKVGKQQRSPHHKGEASRLIINSSPGTAKPPRKRQRVEAPAETWLRKKNASQAKSGGIKSAAVNGKIPPLKFNKRVTKRVKVLPKTRLKPMAKTILYMLRLLIVGVGIGAIVGTVLSVLDPAQTGTIANSSNLEQNQPQVTSNNQALYFTQEIIPLKSTIQSLAVANPKLTPGVFIADLDHGAYVDFNANQPFAAASTIKLPILVAFFQDVDAGRIKLNEMLTMEKEMLAIGSGNMRNQGVGSKFTALEVADKMMTISDNTATNMLIARMGGIQALNQRFRSWGLTATALRNPLPDIPGTNTTSPKELVQVMAMVSKGNLVSMVSRDRLLDIMRRNQRRHLLPQGLGEGAIIANKTGFIGTMLGDVGLIDLPTGKRYVAAVMVQRARNQPGAENLIVSVSRSAYQYFNQARAMPGISGNNSLPATGNSPYLNNQFRGINTYQSPQINPVPNGVSNRMPTTIYPYSSGYNSQYHYPYKN